MTQTEFDALASHLRDVTGHEDPVEHVFGLTPIQEAMLFHAVAAEDSDLYVVQQRIELKGEIDPGLFQQAWSAVIAHHPALRTLFWWHRSGPPLQVVCQGLDVAIEWVDLANDSEATLESRFEQDRQERFLLDRPDMIRIVMFRRSATEHVMLWSQHHLVQDGWSASLVLAEVFAAYQALREDSHVDLDPVPPFSTYVEWLSTKDEAETEAYWRTTFADFETPTRMLEQVPAQDGHYSRTFHTLSQALTTDLNALAATNSLTLNTVLVGVFSVLIGRWTGQRDVAIGFVASGRAPQLDGIDSMVGMLINTLALRTEIDASLPWLKFLEGVQQRQAEALEHDHTSLTNVQSWSGLGPATALTDALFAYWNFGGEGTSPDGSITYQTVDGYGRTSFPFAVTIESGDPITVGLDINADGGTEPDAARFLAEYAALLAAVAADPTQALRSTSIAPAEHADMLESFNDTAMSLEHESVLIAFRTAATNHPEAVAVRFVDTETTYQELDQMSDAIAEQIINLTGFAAHRVGLVLPRSTDMVAGMLGAMKAGAAFVPIDRHLPLERIAFMIEDSDVDLVVTSTSLDEWLTASLDLDSPTLTLPLTDAGDGLDFDIPAGPDDTAYIMYTSGSTGQPKGVEVTHANLANYVLWAADVYADNTAVSFPLYTSPGFDLTITSIFVPLVTGGAIVVYPDDDARDLAVLDVFTDDAVDIVKLTPSHLAILDDHQFAGIRIRSLIVGGEQLPTDVARRVVDASHGRIAIFNEYGPTEATVGCMIHRFDPDNDTAVAVPIGAPAGNVTIALIDATLTPVGPDMVGEIVVGGAGVAAGYLDRPDQTAEKFIDDPATPGATRYRTGDLARWVRPGVLEYIGRSDAQIKLRGHRIEIGEIEAALIGHDGISNAAVAIREPSPGDVRLVGYYVPQASTSTTVTDLKDHLRTTLPEFMVPQHLVRLESLPLTHNGKLNRKALPETIGEHETSTAYVAPTTEAERLVTSLAADLIGVDRLSTTDNFFDLGGHSILSMRLIAQIHDKTGVRISPRTILLNTLGQAAAQLPQTDNEPAQPAPDPSASYEQAVDAVASTALFFGPQERPLFGIHATPSGQATQRRAVLLCPPIGWEYMRTHWAVRKIARLAAAQGHHVFRFDYSGTGDSSGDSSEPTLDTWIGDIELATQELLETSGADSIAIVAVRLGASLAALASPRLDHVDQLVLWDPIIRGDLYLNTLNRMHHEVTSGRRGKVTPVMEGDELMGFPYPGHRRQELARLDLSTHRWPEAASTIVASHPDHTYGQLTVPDLTIDVVDDDAEWDNPDSAQRSLLPVRIPDHIVALLRGAP